MKLVGQYIGPDWDSGITFGFAKNSYSFFELTYLYENESHNIVAGSGSLELIITNKSGRKLEETEIKALMKYMLSNEILDLDSLGAGIYAVRKVFPRDIGVKNAIGEFEESIPLEVYMK